MMNLLDYVHGIFRILNSALFIGGGVWLFKKKLFPALTAKYHHQEAYIASLVVQKKDALQDHEKMIAYKNQEDGDITRLNKNLLLWQEKIKRESDQKRNAHERSILKMQNQYAAKQEHHISIMHAKKILVEASRNALHTLSDEYSNPEKQSRAFAKVLKRFDDGKHE